MIHAGVDLGSRRASWALLTCPAASKLGRNSFSSNLIDLELHWPLGKFMGQLDALRTLRILTHPTFKIVYLAYFRDSSTRQPKPAAVHQFVFSFWFFDSSYSPDLLRYETRISTANSCAAPASDFLGQRGFTRPRGDFVGAKSVSLPLRSSRVAQIRVPPSILQPFGDRNPRIVADMTARVPLSTPFEGSGSLVYEAQLLDADTGAIVQLKYNLVDQIGVGGYGKVYTARSLPTDGTMLGSGELFAVKRIETMGKDLRIVEAQLAGEKLALQLRRDHINPPLGIVQRECGWDIIFPEVFDCDLRALRLNYVERLESELKKKVICESSSALLSVCCRALSDLKLSERHIHQSDLKPDNVLVSLGARNGRKRVVLSDFSVAYVLNEGQVLFQGGQRGTKRYLPPEALQEVPHRHPRSDIHSTALVLLFWITGKDPERLNDGTFDLRPAEHIVPQHVITTLRLMLSSDPAARPSIDQLKLFDSMLQGDEDPTSKFCNVVRGGLHTGAVLGLPLINNVFSPALTSPSQIVQAALFPDDARVSIPEEALVPEIKNFAHVWQAYARPSLPPAPLSSDDGQHHDRPNSVNDTLNDGGAGNSEDVMEVDAMGPASVDFINDEANSDARVMLVGLQNEARKGDPSKIVSVELVQDLANKIMAKLDDMVREPVASMLIEELELEPNSLSHSFRRLRR
eukprot:TRINITY_DN596_c0_g1_i4.p1 TRINITY_DN596_c0_g1~~TRINITY_DN596_c0_g1_i4.p1  ORF type:complete len:687 (-),score=89.22 TRINITY_DN596_c0_g1_i4:1771-3831(-)